MSTQQWRCHYYPSDTSPKQDAYVRIDSATVKVHINSNSQAYTKDQTQVDWQTQDGSAYLRFHDGSYAHITMVDKTNLRRAFGQKVIDQEYWAMVSFILIGSALLIWLAIFSVQWLSQRIAYGIPGEVITQLSSVWVEDMQQQLPPSTLNERQQSMLNQAWQAVFDNTNPDPDIALRLHIRDGGEMGANAFAFPSGDIFVTDQLVHTITHPAQLESVLAHEVAHVHYRHGMQQMASSATMALLIGAVIGFDSVLGNISQSLLGNAYSRDMEREADAFALQYLERRGLPRSHFADMLRNIDNGEAGLAWLSSHPSTEERATAAAY